MRVALEEYLRGLREQEIDRAYAKAYEGRGQAELDEIKNLLPGQAWPAR